MNPAKTRVQENCNNIEENIIFITMVTGIKSHTRKTRCQQIAADIKNDRS